MTARHCHEPTPSTVTTCSPCLLRRRVAQRDANVTQRDANVTQRDTNVTRVTQSDALDAGDAPE